jgi:CheY-like chemotaxis protein
MSAKRALIVDDSRSARVILSRMLETHGLQVDTAESGEQALDYLRGARPDVVFMDHLMPGMDGFEAVRAIKSNTQTAAIPVMMYTSQEGERYLQEARKIGALGVLSKTLKPTDVSRALYELNLLPDRRELQSAEESRATRTEPRTPYAANSPSNSLVGPIHRPAQVEVNTAPTMAASAAPRLGTQELRATVSALVNEQNAELLQLLQSSLDAMSNRLSAELRATAQQVVLSTQVATGASESNGSRGWFAAALILVALIPTAVIAALYWRTLNDNQAQLEQSTSRLAMVVTDQQTQIEQLRAELRKRQDAGGDIAVVGSNEETVAVPYGELPLANARVQRLQAMLGRLQADGFRGKLRVSSFAGDFCLTGNAINGYKLASDELPARRCDLIGNPFDDGLTAAQRQSPEFANAIANASGKMRIEVFTEGRKPAVPYPQQSDKLTAGEWNRIAARNNRVEFAAVTAE